MKVQDKYPDLSKELFLKVAIKAMNDTMEENGLVPF